MLSQWTKPISPFYLADGRIVRRLSELVKLLDDIDDHIFEFHVNEHKNDFYEWIKNCLNEDIADVIKDKKNKHEMKVALLMELLREVEIEQS